MGELRYVVCGHCMCAFPDVEYACPRCGTSRDDPAEYADHLAGEVRTMLECIRNIDFGDHYCDAESMLIVNNMLSDLDMVSFAEEKDDDS